MSNLKQLDKQDVKLQTKEEEWAKKKDLLERKQKIKSEKKNLKKSKRGMSTSKKVMAFLLINCSAIEIFTGWATYQNLMSASYWGSYVDFSPLITLITAVVGEVVSFAVYAAKATKENTSGGITYLQAEQSLLDNNENGVG